MRVKCNEKNCSSKRDESFYFSRITARENIENWNRFNFVKFVKNFEI